MKNEKGITLTSLVIYMVVFGIIIGIMSTISVNFHENVKKVLESPKYVTEFNKFAMFFVNDVKSNKTATINDNEITFEDGTVYNYTNNAIYRNNELIAKYVIECNFEAGTYEVNELIKNLINVNMKLGTEREQITRTIEFVLKYW